MSRCTAKVISNSNKFGSTDLFNELFCSLMIKKTLSISILIISLFSISLYSQQELVLKRNNVHFSLVLLSDDTEPPRKGFHIKYSVLNNSDHQIAVPDFDIPGKVPLRNIGRGSRDWEISLDLGGYYLLNEGWVRKFRILQPGEEYAIDIYLPINGYLDHFNKSQEKEIPQNKYPYPKIKNIDIIARIAYLESPVIDDDFKEITEFDDYWGIPQDYRSYGDIHYLAEIFTLSGITVNINLQNKK